MGKAALIIGLGAGYVLGTRDGRQRYEQLKAHANRVANDPRVQHKATHVRDLAKQKAPLFQEKRGRAAHKANEEKGHPSSATTQTPNDAAAAGVTPIPDPQHAPDPVIGDMDA